MIIQPQSKEEIVKNLEAIANSSRDINLSDHTEASLWNAIEILEDLIEEQKKGLP